MPEGVTGTDPAPELARLDALAEVTKAYAKAGYGNADQGGRGLSLLPVAVVAAGAGLLGAVRPAWAFVLASSLPVSMLAQPFARRYLRHGEVRPFSFVPPPDPKALRAGRVAAGLVWLLAGSALLVQVRRLAEFPGLPRGAVLLAWAFSFLAVGHLGWRARSSWGWVNASGIYLGLLGGDATADRVRSGRWMLGLLILAAVAAVLGVADHLRFRKLDLRLRTLRERG